MDQDAGALLTLYWDFFGPRARRTAEHFLEHLRGFLEEHRVTADVGMASLGAGHEGVFCRPPDADREMIQQCLCPQRVD